MYGFVGSFCLDIKNVVPNIASNWPQLSFIADWFDNRFFNPGFSICNWKEEIVNKSFHKLIQSFLVTVSLKPIRYGDLILFSIITSIIRLIACIIKKELPLSFKNDRKFFRAL